ncbi:hypothetical protein BDZ89DRAFT_456433 [Hymenopellis radicata]|nr:hypothetical protein BDZ89DRAFT_456433 [Hymenopellis radicata]
MVDLNLWMSSPFTHSDVCRSTLLFVTYTVQINFGQVQARQDFLSFKLLRPQASATVLNRPTCSADGTKHSLSCGERGYSYQTYPRKRPSTRPCPSWRESLIPVMVPFKCSIFATRTASNNEHLVDWVLCNTTSQERALWTKLGPSPTVDVEEEPVYCF